MTLAEKLADLVETYAPIDDPQERMALLVDTGARRRPLAEEHRTDANRVRGCVSAAWLEGHLEDGRCQFTCAADSPLVLGLLAALCEFFSGASAAEVAASDADPLGALGVTRNLSPTRQNGLGHARARLREIAAELAKGA